MAERPIGVLVAALGTPEAPTTAAVRPYLREFLSDRRVVDMNPFLWQIILRLFVLPRRPARSAALYRRIWTPEGSPLMVHSRAQVAGLQTRLGEGFRVVLGMRYGQPSIQSALQTLTAEGLDRILIFSMFPQFSSATTASIDDAVSRAALGRRCPLFYERTRYVPTLRYVPPYYDHPAYLDALRVLLEEQRAQADFDADHILFSFHGIPQRFATEGDPYPDQCKITAHKLAAALGLGAEDWSLSFQSQFGREAWLQPYTVSALERSAAQRKRLLVACPGFTTDCLETLDEIGHEGAELFHAAGGEHYHTAPCLNAHPRWLDAMAQIVHEETSGWRHTGAASL
jgi:ferrochelatase